ncbi:MAG: hypothetical protein KME26_24680 [Oscillatoria princeps RMCB-10]|nr:hypothetical protein [Oscillatoria princeps RMCB-10]
MNEGVRKWLEEEIPAVGLKSRSSESLLSWLSQAEDWPGKLSFSWGN